MRILPILAVTLLVLTALFPQPIRATSPCQSAPDDPSGCTNCTLVDSTFTCTCDGASKSLDMSTCAVCYVEYIDGNLVCDYMSINLLAIVQFVDASQDTATFTYYYDLSENDEDTQGLLGIDDEKIVLSNQKKAMIVYDFIFKDHTDAFITTGWQLADLTQASPDDQAINLNWPSSLTPGRIGDTTCSIRDDGASDVAVGFTFSFTDPGTGKTLTSPDPTLIVKSDPATF